jgi:hypothetical protein
LSIAGILNGDNRGFTDHDPLPFEVNQGVGGPEVDGEIVGKHTPYFIEKVEHAAKLLSSDEKRGVTLSKKTLLTLAKPSLIFKE